MFSTYKLYFRTLFITSFKKLTKTKKKQKVNSGRYVYFYLK